MESSTLSANPTTELFQPPVEAEGEALSASPYQMQLLQQEVMELRGLVEELTYKIERMRKTEEDRYLELDARFQTLVVPVADEPDVLPITVGSVADAIGAKDEETLYDTALELIGNRQYELAVTQLNAVIGQYPDGKYTANAYYWLGDVYTAMPRPQYENARQALAQVVSFFPDHQKVPHAMYKLGVVYNLMGDCQKATEILNQVISEQQGKSVATLAETHLRDKVNCGN